MMAPRNISVSYSASPDTHSLAIHNRDQSDCDSFIFDDSDKRENNMEEEIATKREEGVSDSVWNQVQKSIKNEKTEQDILKELDENLQKAGHALAQGTEDELKTLQKSHDHAHAVFDDYNLLLKQKKKIQRTLKKMGTCPLGYVWRRDVGGGGYRCAGGSHFVTNEEINNMVEYEN